MTRAALDALIDGRPEVGVFLSRAWLSGFFADPPTAPSPRSSLLRQGRCCAASVPLAIRPDPDACVRCRSLAAHSVRSRRSALPPRVSRRRIAIRSSPGLPRRSARRVRLLEFRDVPVDFRAVGRDPARRCRRHTARRASAAGNLHAAVSGSRTTSVSHAVRDAPSAAFARSLEKHRRWLDIRCRLQIDVLDDRDEVHGCVRVPRRVPPHALARLDRRVRARRSTRVPIPSPAALPRC